MNKTWGRHAAVLCIAAFGLTGCGGDDKPTSSSTPTPTTSGSAASPSSSGSASGSGSASPSPSVSASPSATASVPAAAKARTEAGAIAFLNFYFDQAGKGLLEPRKAPDLFAIADKDCIACKKTQDLFAEYAKGGWSMRQSGIRIENAALATEITAPSVLLNFTFVQTEQPLYQYGQKTSHKISASNTKKGAALKWVNGAWQMYDIENL
ncbi:MULTISPECIES: DUF6318 family protein [unclassified Knoellia]|uniref:DUF6318 family protein n=1 Tax=Knoellia altitudinis TaxID=3404795 RepID=UPI0036087892